MSYLWARYSKRDLFREVCIMFNGSNINDNLIKQRASERYVEKEDKHALEDQNTIVVTNKENKKGLINKIKQFFKKLSN